MEPLLQVDGVTKAFGGLLALDQVSLAVRPGEIRALIGPNGAGKTTLINLITGVYRPTRGRIRLTGRSIVDSPPHEITRLGVARTFQTVRLFAEMSVLDNVRVGYGCQARSGLLAAIGRTAQMRGEEAGSRSSGLAVLREVGLQDRAAILAKHLPYGQQRLVEVARALATAPKLLLLDEPVAGLNPRETNELTGLIHHLRDSGVTILLIEHNMRFVTAIAETVTVLEFGRTIADGPVQDVMNDPRVIAAYLGREDAHAAP